MELVLEYTLTKDDYEVFQRQILNGGLGRDPRNRRRRVLTSFFVAFFVALAFWISGPLLLPDGFELGTSSLVTASLALLAAWFLLWFKAARTKKRLALDEDGTVLGAKRMVFGSEGIEETGRLQLSQTKWAAVRYIIDHPEHIYFQLEEAVAYIVPKRVFESGDEAREFYSAAQEMKDLAGKRTDT